MLLLDSDGKIGRLYGAKTTPHMFVVGPEGKILYNGAIDDDTRGGAENPRNYVDAALASATAGKTIEFAQTKPYGCSVKYAPKEDVKAKATSR